MIHRGRHLASTTTPRAMNPRPAVIPGTNPPEVARTKAEPPSAAMDDATMTAGVAESQDVQPTRLRGERPFTCRSRGTGRTRSC